MISPALSQETLSLLVVEDNRDSADSLAVILRNFGHRVSIAYDGDQAARMIDASTFDAVLCDIGLPGQSGYEVAAHVRRVRGRQPLIVAISAYSTECVQTNARIAGFDNFFSKPADPDALQHLLSEHVRLGRLRKSTSA